VSGRRPASSPLSFGPRTGRRPANLLKPTPSRPFAHQAFDERTRARRTRGVSPARWQLLSEVPAKARWGAAGWVTRSHTLAETSTRLKAGAAQQGWRRGTPARVAHRAAGPRPWRAWVRPAGARAHHHLHQHIHGTKAGSQQRISNPPATARPGTRRGGQATLFPGLAARRTLGVAHDGAAHDDAARGVPQPYLQVPQEPKTATALGRHGLG
jgi:hypothetical protein